MTLLLDDHLLLRVLLDDPPAALPGDRPLATSGLWYHRLCRALRTPTVTGALSRGLGDAPPAVAQHVIGALVELPPEISLVSLRSLGWPMAGLVAAGVRGNLLTLEALAAAQELDAEICLAEANDHRALQEAAATMDIGVRVVG